MATPTKVSAVEEITNDFKDSTAAVLTEYRGLTVAQLKELRRSLGQDTKYSVVKNTLTRFAVKNAGLDELEPVLNGTTSLAVCANDPVAPAKVVAEFAKKMNGQKFVIKAGFVDGKVIDVAGVNALAELPSKEVLLSMLLSAMQGPVRGLAVSLDATISGLARALQAVADQKAG